MGTAQVMRHALLMIVLCELLEVDLDDSRLAQARDSTLEMVADSEISETAGLSWALTVSNLKVVDACTPACHDEGTRDSSTFADMADCWDRFIA